MLLELNWCVSVTYALTPHTAFILFSNLFFLAGRWSTSGSRGVTHISCHHTRIRLRETGENKTDEQHEQSLGLTKSRRRYCNTTCMCGLSLAWVTSENSTSNSNADILSRSSSLWLDPLFSATVSGVRCWLPLSVVPRQLCFLSSRQLLSSGSCRQLLSAPLSNPLSRPLTTSGYGEISGPKILCLVSCRNRQRNRLLRPPI